MFVISINVFVYSIIFFTCLSLISYAAVHLPVDRHFVKLYTLHVLKYIIYIYITDADQTIQLPE